MNAYVAPLYCQTNALSQEKLALGLILLANNPDGPPTVFFKLSEKKAQLAEKLTGVSKSFFAATEKYIQNFVQEVKHQPPLMAKLAKNPALLNKKVYAYLQQYAHGLLEFGVLKPFSGPIDEATFDHLFADFTGDTSEPSATSEKASFRAVLKERLNIPLLQAKADIGFQFTPDRLPGILKKTTAEAITVNGQVESLHALNLESSRETISNRLNELEVYYSALQAFVEGTSHLNKLIIAFNPASSGSEQERLFNTALDQKSSIFGFLPIDEIEKFTQPISAGEYRKFSEVF